jgi:hypothetical protein
MTPQRAAMVGNLIAIGYLGTRWPLLVPNGAAAHSRRLILLLYLFDRQTA